MNIHSLYRNPEVKKITIKYLIILLISIVLMIISTKIVTDSINKRIIDQNVMIVSNILEGKKIDDIIPNFYHKKQEEQLSEARELLKSYGYDENMSDKSNELIDFCSKEILMINIPIIILVLTLMYIMYNLELKNIFNKLSDVSNSIKFMSDGKYKKIDGETKEGEIGVLISSVNYMGERVNNSINLLTKEKNNLKDFLSDISHQLKTPLASLVMFNDLMKENENMSIEDRRNFLQKSEEQLTRMEWLVMNLLKVGRLEAGAIVFKKEKTNLNETIDLAVSSLEQQAKTKNQSLIIKEQKNIILEHDKEWLAEALSNIIKNAIEHTDEGGKIQIETEQTKLFTYIYIKDNGKGISEEKQKKIFKRFYKGESSTDPKSIGIGLSLAQSIIEEQGGEIKVKSKEGKGTTFCISFLKK